MSSSSRSADLTITRVGGLHVGFRLDAVQEVLMASTITPVPLAEPGFVGLINVRGEILSVVDLALRLGLTDPHGEVLPETAGKSNHVIVRTTRGLVAVTVDKVNDVVHAGAETYEDVRGGAAEFFTGAYALPSRLVLVLDIDRAVWRQRDLVASA